MDAQHWLADRFEADRSRLQAMAYRMLGSLTEADDALQDSWLKVSRADTSSVENLGGWLTTVVARVCLDVLRSRASRREDPLGPQGPEPPTHSRSAVDPEEEAVLADSVGLALLVMLDTLEPAERLAFVLHDLFGVPFAEIAPIVARSPAATRQLASRARRRVRGSATPPQSDIERQREVIDAFLAAARGGDLDALVAVLDPDIVLRADHLARPVDAPREVHGARAVAARAVVGGARAARPALVNGSVGLVVAPRGRLLMVLAVTIRDGRIAEIDAIADPARLAGVEIALLGDDPAWRL